MTWQIGRRYLAALALAAVTVANLGWLNTAQAEGLAAAPRYDLFYNYYEGGGVSGGLPVGMYPSPQPVPARVGGTYMTYQALYPHQFMYPHAQTYRRYKRGNVVPMNTTRAVYW